MTPDDQPAKKCRLFHRWAHQGALDMFTLLDRCEKCGWWRTNNPITQAGFIYPPDAITDDRKDGTR